MKKALIIVCCALCCFAANSQLPDVQQYHFNIELSDRSDSIKGLATIRFKLNSDYKTVDFDLAAVRNGKGMQVQAVTAADKPLQFTHRQDVVRIQLTDSMQAAPEGEVQIRYAGIPSDGLIISKNKYGDRTFFSDNWPNRAHQWVPCNDRPDDKAAVTFAVTAPAHYQVISNGMLQEETNVGEEKRTVWQEATPIPTKVMVIGAARMATGYLDTAAGVPVWAWVYPQDRDRGFEDYARTKEMLRFFTAYIGPYAFQKLANVQSKTIFGGMENASAIFYAENSITNDIASEGLMAHEVAHQWFGNTVTERSFAHLWLSEGFATYLTNIYLEQKYGLRKLQDNLAAERQQVIDFSRREKSAVVNETPNLMSLLNANSYQKGGWVLHMLRRELGDPVFKQILQTYYRRFGGGNADTPDFQKVAEEISGKQLGTFFSQWLYKPGLPKINVQWKWSGGTVQATVQQTGETHFSFPLEIGFVDAQGIQTIHRIFVNKTKERFDLPATQKPTVVLLDPAVNLLFEGTIRE
jgi:aminopeptidase N